MTVWAVQNVHWVDRSDGKLKPKFDFTSAARWGEVRFLLPPTASPFSLMGPMSIMHDKLQDYDAHSDYLLLVGSPVLLGLAVAIAADKSGGNVNMLQWSGAKRDYLPVKVTNVFAETDCRDIP